MKNQDVHVKLGKLYFEKCFEPDRRRMEQKLGIKLSQVRFTEILARQRLGIKQPNINIKKDKFKSVPKQFRR
jgi:hypothetical protein